MEWAFPSPPLLAFHANSRSGAEKAEEGGRDEKMQKIKLMWEHDLKLRVHEGRQEA